MILTQLLETVQEGMVIQEDAFFRRIDRTALKALYLETLRLSLSGEGTSIKET